MRTFGISQARGRRSVPRAEAPLIAVLATGAAHHSAELIDLSRTGARLQGADFPAADADLVFHAGKVRAAGEVIWIDGDQCGVSFDTPIAAVEVNRIRVLANLATPQQHRDARRSCAN
jgi:hypothetical protein